MLYDTGMKNFVTFEEHKKKLLKNPELKKAYDELEEEYALIEAIIRKRIELGMTQSELAKLTGTKQSAISRVESEGYNPSFQYLRRLAKAFGCKLKIEFV
jgi:ribosome-binding protein aMBF1 (putative translation factor)